MQQLGNGVGGPGGDGATQVKFFGALREQGASPIQPLPPRALGPTGSGLCHGPGAGVEKLHLEIIGTTLKKKPQPSQASRFSLTDHGVTVQVPADVRSLGVTASLGFGAANMITT